jgi:hypothetical protein
MKPVQTNLALGKDSHGASKSAPLSVCPIKMTLQTNKSFTLHVKKWPRRIRETEYACLLRKRLELRATQDLVEALAPPSSLYKTASARHTSLQNPGSRSPLPALWRWRSPTTPVSLQAWISTPMLASIYLHPWG